MNNTVLIYEELASNAHPARQTQLYDGWVLRFAGGYTNRANSVNPLYPSTIHLETKIAECEKRYFAEGLPAVFKMSESVDPRLDGLLAEGGYELITPTYTMTADLRDKEFRPAGCDCVMTDRPVSEWLEAFFTLNNHSNTVRAIAGRLLENTQNTALFVRLVKDGTTVACGSLVIERGYMGLFNVVVDETRRGIGYGKEICESLLSEAVRLGAHTAYLQVLQGNEKALNIYRRLGYEILYPYWYRIKRM